MPGLESSPLAVLTFIAAPAILTNASSVLALGTSNRFARNVERARQIINTMRSANDKTDAEMIEMYRGQLARTELRATLLIRSLSSFYFSLGCFAAGSLLSLLGAILAASEYHALLHVLLGMALVAGVLGLTGLIVGCVQLLRETRLALQSLREDTRFFRKHYEAAEAKGKN
jgi:hypothetical protein